MERFIDIVTCIDVCRTAFDTLLSKSQIAEYRKFAFLFLYERREPRKVLLQAHDLDFFRFMKRFPNSLMIYCPGRAAHI